MEEDVPKVLSVDVSDTGCAVIEDEGLMPPGGAPATSSPAHLEDGDLEETRVVESIGEEATCHPGAADRHSTSLAHRRGKRRRETDCSTHGADPVMEVGRGLMDS